MSSDLPDRAPAPAPPDPRSDFDRLKELLVGPETRQVAHLHTRLADPEARSRDVSEVLPDAVRLATARDGDALGRALSPAVESALREAIRRDPSTVVGAVFPIIGPAIRRAISDALGRLVQSINLALEYGFSWRGWRWRLEAWRTGRSFADVLIYHTLVYRVEEVFLIHRPTSLLLQHVHAPEIAPADSDLVAAMLAAIQDFVRDSFRPDQGETLSQLEFSDLHVWIEHGPFASLAAVVRGHAPKDYRTLLQRTLEHAHLAAHQDLQRFHSDPSRFDSLRPRLEDCLQTEYVRGLRPPGRRPRARFLLAAAALLLALAVWVFAGYRERRAWTAYLDRLNTEDGLVLLRAGRHADGYFIEGLRDPLAADPQSFLSTQHLSPSRVRQRWKTYHSPTPALVLQRARLRVPPPPGVNYLFTNGRLTVAGAPPPDWTDPALAALLLIAGVDEVRLSTPAPATPLPDPASLLAELHDTAVYFGSGIQLLPGQDATLDRMAAALRDLAGIADHAGLPLKITVLGHTDNTGPAERNPPLSEQRARVVADLLAGRGVPASSLTVEGRGSTTPVAQGPGADSRRNRRVTLNVVSPPSAP